MRSQYDCIQKNISKFNQNYLKETWKTPELKINTLAASAHVKYDVSKIEVNLMKTQNKRIEKENDIMSGPDLKTSK